MERLKQLLLASVAALLDTILAPYRWCYWKWVQGHYAADAQHVLGQIAAVQDSVLREKLRGNVTEVFEEARCGTIGGVGVLLKLKQIEYTALQGLTLDGWQAARVIRRDLGRTFAPAVEIDEISAQIEKLAAVGGGATMRLIEYVAPTCLGYWRQFAEVSSLRGRRSFQIAFSLVFLLFFYFVVRYGDQGFRFLIEGLAGVPDVDRFRIAIENFFSWAKQTPEILAVVFGSVGAMVSLNTRIDATDVGGAGVRPFEREFPFRTLLRRVALGAWAAIFANLIALTLFPQPRPVAADVFHVLLLFSAGFAERFLDNLAEATLKRANAATEKALAGPDGAQ